MSCNQHGYPWTSLATPPNHPLLPAGLLGYNPYRHKVIKLNVIIIMSCHQHGYQWTSLATPPNRPLLPAGLLGYNPYRHKVLKLNVIIIMSCHQHGYPWTSLATPPNRPLLPAGLLGYNPYRHKVLKLNVIIIMSCHQHGYPWTSLATPPNRPLLPAGLPGYIPYRHRAALCRSWLVVLPLLVHVKGSTGVHHLWVRLYFSSSLVRLVSKVFVMGGGWPYSCCFDGMLLPGLVQYCSRNSCVVAVKLFLQTFSSIPCSASIQQYRNDCCWLPYDRKPIINCPYLC